MKKIQIVLTLVVASMIASLTLSSCSGSQSGQVDGSGATFPLPFYNLAFKTYNETRGVTVNYGAIGSGGGLRNLTDKVVDFAGSDAFMSDEDMKEIPEVIHVPTCMGAVVVAYNMPELKTLNLTGSLVADIFMGKISMWNDDAIKAENPNIELPEKAITVVYRSDGSGTTNIFSDYLCKVSPEWNETIGRGKSLKWPVGLAAKGNPGVAGVISQTDGAIGYIGSEYSFSQNIPTASIKNRAGKFILPTIESVSSSAPTNIPDDTRIMITDADGADSYPISCLTWIVLYKEQSYDGRTKEKAQETANLVSWMLSDEAQALTVKVHYAPLSPAIAKKAKAQVASLTFNGKALK